jgi:hypothetical protein
MTWGFAVRLGCCAVALTWAWILPVAPALASTCPPGHLNNPYNSQCYVVGSAPTINGVPCVASNFGVCSAFIQNQPPPRRPTARVG